MISQCLREKPSGMRGTCPPDIIPPPRGDSRLGQMWCGIVEGGGGGGSRRGGGRKGGKSQKREKKVKGKGRKSVPQAREKIGFWGLKTSKILFFLQIFQTGGIGGI